jgi:hypothetical protein
MSLARRLATRRRPSLLMRHYEPVRAAGAVSSGPIADNAAFLNRPIDSDPLRCQRLEAQELRRARRCLTYALILGTYTTQINSERPLWMR